MRILHERQRRFLLQFPEAPWIEASRHNRRPGESLGAWEWPHRYFRQREDIENIPLQHMSRLGIWPQTPGRRSNPNNLSTPIWYNTVQDRAVMAREAGRPAIFLYRDWTCVPIARGVYARSFDHPRCRVTVRNVTGEPVQGRFTLVGGVAAQTGRCRVEFRLNGQPLGKAEPMTCGAFEQRTSVPCTLPPGDSTLSWGVNRADVRTVQRLLVMQCSFQQ